MTKSPTVLLIASDRQETRQTHGLLEFPASPAFAIAHAPEFHDAITALTQRSYEAILLDLLFPHGSGVGGSPPNRRAPGRRADRCPDPRRRCDPRAADAARGSQDRLPRTDLIASALIRAIQHAADRQRILQERAVRQLRKLCQRHRASAVGNRRRAVDGRLDPRVAPPCETGDGTTVRRAYGKRQRFVAYSIALADGGCQIFLPEPINDRDADNDRAALDVEVSRLWMVRNNR